MVGPKAVSGSSSAFFLLLAPTLILSIPLGRIARPVGLLVAILLISMVFYRRRRSKAAHNKGKPTPPSVARALSG